MVLEVYNLFILLFKDLYYFNGTLKGNIVEILSVEYFFAVGVGS